MVKELGKAVNDTESKLLTNPHTYNFILWMANRNFKQIFPRKTLSL